MIGKTARGFAFAGLAIATIAGSAPALAQDADAQTRIRKLEAEVKALQRRVFPGGDGKYFEPEITGQPAPRPTVTAPSTTALTDVLARLDALEGQIRRLTAQSEENSNQVRLLTDRVALLEKGSAPPNVADPALAKTLPAAEKPVADKPIAAKPAETKPVAKPAGPSSERLAAVKAILKPQTEDAGDDEYSYGYRLWDAKFFPEAQQQLTMMVEKYPKHAKISFARNLLGRAYLDDGKAKEAAPWFLKNYQADKAGARAGDSLLFLAESMIALKDTKRACIALAEFSETYPALATGRLQSQYEADRGKVKCN